MSKELANTGKHSFISSANQSRSKFRNKDTVAAGLEDIQGTITKLEISKLTSYIFLEVAKTHQSNSNKQETKILLSFQARQQEIS